MSSLFDRVGKVVKSEWNARFSEDDPNAPKEPPEDQAETSYEAHSPDALDPKNGGRESHAHRLPKNQKSPRRQGISDAHQALRMLELPDNASLDEVRARYFDLAIRYHPRTVNGTPDQAYAAQTVLVTLTDALEILESHLLPIA